MEIVASLFLRPDVSGFISRPWLHVVFCATGSAFPEFYSKPELSTDPCLDGV